MKKITSLSDFFANHVLSDSEAESIKGGQQGPGGIKGPGGDPPPPPSA